MKFKIRDLTFYTKATPCKKGQLPEFDAWVLFADGTHRSITKDLGVGSAGTETGACYQMLVWIEKVGI